MKVSVAVKVSPILFAKVSISVSSILSAESIGIDIGDNICKYR